MSQTGWLIAIAFWVICAAMAYFIADARGSKNPGSYAMMGLLLGPIGPIAALFVSPPKPIDPAAMIRIPDPVGQPADATFCARCGAARPAGAAFCSSCGAAFASEPVAAPQPKSKSNARGLIIVGAIIVVIIAVLAAQPGGLSRFLNTVPSSGNVPPAGSIWFGDSFDPNTFELRGQRTSVPASQAYSMVGHLTRSVAATELAMRITFDGQVVSNAAVKAQGEGDLWGFTPGPLFAAGQWTFALTDVGGNTLAEGTITAT